MTITEKLKKLEPKKKTTKETLVISKNDWHKEYQTKPAAVLYGNTNNKSSQLFGRKYSVTTTEDSYIITRIK